MTRYMSSHTGRTMRPEPYEISYADDEDDDDDDFDDEDLDGYDNLTDYDDEDEPSQNRSGGRHMASGSVDDRASLNDSRRQRSVSEGSGSLLEPCDDNRRDHHNQLERKRRASIKTSYNDLREAIPSLRGSKASRAVILQRAVECIEELLKRNRDHSHCVETLRRQNDLLDSRVQELQRLVQRLDGEEAAAAAAATATVTVSSSAISHGLNSYTNGTGTTAPGAGATLRLVSGNLTSPGIATSGSGTTHLPVYRLMPQESTGSDRITNSNGITHVLTSTTTAVRSNILGAVHHGPINSSRNRVSPALHPIASHSNSNSCSPSFNGLNVLNTAVSLVASAHSAFSSASSPSVGSTNGDATAPQSSSSSQRSSPGSYSSTSSSSASSLSLGNAPVLSRQLPPITNVDDESVLEEVSTVGCGFVETAIVAQRSNNKPKSDTSLSSSSLVQPLAPPPPPASTTNVLHPASPPSILLAVPVRHPPSNASMSEDDLLLSSKRRRLS